MLTVHTIPQSIPIQSAHLVSWVVVIETKPRRLITGVGTESVHIGIRASGRHGWLLIGVAAVDVGVEGVGRLSSHLRPHIQPTARLLPSLSPLIRLHIVLGLPVLSIHPIQIHHSIHSRMVSGRLSRVLKRRLLILNPLLLHVGYRWILVGVGELIVDAVGQGDLSVRCDSVVLLLLHSLRILGILILSSHHSIHITSQVPNRIPHLTHKRPSGIHHLSRHSTQRNPSTIIWSIATVGNLHVLSVTVVVLKVLLILLDGVRLGVCSPLWDEEIEAILLLDVQILVVVVRRVSHDTVLREAEVVAVGAAAVSLIGCLLQLNDSRSVTLWDGWVEHGLRRISLLKRRRDP